MRMPTAEEAEQALKAWMAEQPTESGNGNHHDQTAIDRRYLQLQKQLLNTDKLRELTPPTYLINNWLIKDSLAWISGKPGHGKSFIALDMACSVATGINWQGNPVQQGPILYLAAEGAAGLSIRLDAWVTANQYPDETNLHFLPVPIKLIDTDHVDVAAMTQLLQQLKPTLVIIDTQARVTTGLEENSSKDMGRFVEALEALRAAVPATYLIVHHTPRNGDNLRGSTALEGAAETIVRASQEGDLITLECQKQKNGAPPEDLQMHMTQLAESIVLDYRAVGLEDHNTKSQDQLLQFMLTQYGTDEVGATELYEASGMGKQTFYNSVNPLVKRGKILKRETSNRKFYRLP